MKNIAVAEMPHYNSFITHLRNMMNVLDIKCSIVSNSDTKDKALDYFIINDNIIPKDYVLNAKYCFINMDNRLYGNVIVKGNVITYGLGIKNTVTVSSLEENNLEFVYCLQRYLTIADEGSLEPQEIPVKLQFNIDTELYASMIAITIALIEGIDCTEIKKKLNKKVLILS